MVTFRTAQGAPDIRILVRMAGRMYRQSRFSHMEFDSMRLRKTLRYILPVGTSFIVEKDGKPVGAIVSTILPQIFSPSLQTIDLGVFLEEEHRSYQTARAMVAEYVRRALEAGAEDITLAQITGDRIEGMARLYRHCGFAQVGGVFAYGRLVRAG